MPTLFAQDKAETPAPAVSAAGTVAIVGGAPITEADLQEVAGPQLAELRMREHQVRGQALEEVIARRLVGREAAARGVTEEALVRQEIEEKAVPTPAEMEAFYNENKARLASFPEAEGRKRADDQLRQVKRRDRQTAFLKELRAKAGVRVLMEPLRVAVAVGDAPPRGPADAPVTIVEFSDFQCPFCARARPTIAKVRETYAGKIKLYYRDFPLQMHAQAGKAAEAADCAGEQSRFWEMHDRLFANPQNLADTDLKAHAVALGLDAPKFASCLDSGRHEAGWRSDMQEGVALGVSGTPAFFINGRPLVGAQPFEAFAQLIDEELERAAAKAPAGGTAEKR